MLLQSLLLIATLIIMGSALLTSTLVNAKTAFHQMVARKTQAAMIDATSEFTAWAQENVRTNGIAQLPVWSATFQQRPLQSLCQPAEEHGAAASPPSSCALFQRIQWNVTGHTGSISNAASNDTLLSTASNIATAQDEQRISATITVAITNAGGDIIFANHSRQVTARLFHAFPFIDIGDTGCFQRSGQYFIVRRRYRGLFISTPTDRRSIGPRRRYASTIHQHRYSNHRRLS